MKKFNILILLLSCSVCCVAQKNNTIPSRNSVLRALLKDPYYCDSPRVQGSAKFYYTDQQYITNYSMNRLIRQDITKITLGQDGLPVLGNYASLQYSDDKSTITLNTSIYNPFRKSSETDPMKSILSLTVKAGISDGAAALFSGKDVNSGVGIKAKMSFLTRKTLYVAKSNVDCATLKLYRDRLFDNYIMEKDAYNLAKSLKQDDYQLKIEKAQKELCEIKINRQQVEKDKASARKDIVSLKKALEVKPGKKDSDNVRWKKAQLDTLIAIADKYDGAKLKLFQIKSEYNTYISQNLGYDQNATIDSYYKQLLDIETKNVKWKQFRIEFWDVNVNLAGDRYNVFVPSLPVSKQLSKANFTTWSVGATFNHFASNDSHSFIKNGIFYKIGYTLSDDNNFNGAKTKSITNTTTIDTTGFKREVVDNVSAYVGPLTKFFAHTFTGQFSKYLDEKKSNALSLYTTVILNFDKLNAPLTIPEKPDWTFGTGYTFSLLDKDNLKSVLNLELYFNFNDMLNSAKEEDSKFYQRREIGLKIGVPFNSIFLNK